MATTEAPLTTTEGGFKINVPLTIAACCLIVVVALGVAGFVLYDWFKRRKERQQLERERVNLEEAFAGPQKQEGGNKNIYGVLWASGAEMSAKGRSKRSEKEPLMTTCKSPTAPTTPSAEHGDENGGKREENSKEQVQPMGIGEKSAEKTDQ